MTGQPGNADHREPTASIVDVQRFSLHDGPGIRTLVFFKGCALRCSWCQNPESQKATAELSFHPQRCVEDFNCAEVCRERAIVPGASRVDASRCTLCGQCVSACLHDALRWVGQEHTPRQLMERLLADRAYYDASGGGVTFSGGEATLHPRFLREVLERCRAVGLHTTLETAGTFSFEPLEPMLRMLDLIYFDLKLLDPELHRRYVAPNRRNHPADRPAGGSMMTSLDRIVTNARHLVEGGFPVEFRTPLVPGLTDTADNVQRIAAFLGELGVRSLHLLQYNPLGESKINTLAGEFPRLGLAPQTDAELTQVESLFRTHGIETRR